MLLTRLNPEKVVVKPLVLFVFFLSVSLYQARSQDRWTLIKNEKGIMVYTKSTDTSRIKSIKTVMYLKTSLSSLVALIQDARNLHNWVYNNEYGEMLEQSSSMMTVSYTQTDLPWPVSDRDVVASIRITQYPVTKEVDICSESKNNFFSEKEGFVRIRKFHAIWRLIPEIEGLVRVEFELYVDPAGNIPAWIANMTIKKGPYKTMLNMQKEILCDRYKNASLPFIMEPDKKDVYKNDPVTTKKK